MATDLNQLIMESGVYKIYDNNKYNYIPLTTYFQNKNSICGDSKIKIKSVIPNRSLFTSDDLTSDLKECYDNVDTSNVFTMNKCLNGLISYYELPTTIGSNAINQTAKTTKTDFVSLYNEHYSYNVELLVGITIITAVLAKMIFYPMKI